MATNERPTASQTFGPADARPGGAGGASAPDEAPRKGRGVATAPSSGHPDGQSHSWWGRLRRNAWQWFWTLAALLLVNWLLSLFFLPSTAPPTLTVPYTVFKQQVQAGNVSQIVSQDAQIQGTFKQSITYPPTGANAQTSTSFQTEVPAFANDDLEALLEQNGVVVTASPLAAGPSAWLTLLLNFGPAVLFFGLMLWMGTRAQAAQGGAFGFGRSRARRYDESSPDQAHVTFADVAGIDEAKEDLEEVVDFLKHPEKYQRLGGSIPTGVLLVGPPGTGKTLLAKAVAGEAGVPFFSLSGSEFVEMIVGVGAARVRDLFANAKKEAPAIIFVDELDAIGRRRGGNAFGGANSEQEQTLNQILTEMDGFAARQAVIVLAATNRPEVLDPALLRPGRFDRRVAVQRPDRVGREAILKVHTRGVPLAKGVNLAQMAAATPGLVGAELRNLVNEAALLAARRDEDAVTQQDFFDAMEKIVLGSERKLVMSPDDRRRVAYHEAGHALLGLVLPDSDPVHKVSIVPRGQALGVTYQVPLDDRVNYGERYLRTRITGALGGRAAEELVFRTVSTGAENDLQQATQIARQMVTRWGMSERVGLIYVAQPDGGFLGSDGTVPEMGREVGDHLADVVDEETQRVLGECYAAAQETLAREQGRLVALADALVAHESLDEDQIRLVTHLPAQPVGQAPGPNTHPKPAPAAPASAAPIRA